MNKGLPIYLEIANQLRQNLKDGVYKPGERLPTEEEFATRFGVNRHTLRRSISLLKAEGLLRVDQGRGTFVASAPIRYPIGKRVRYNEALKAQGLKPNSKTLRAIQIPAEPPVTEVFAMTVGTPVALVERIALADEQPLSIASSYFPITRFPDILRHCQTMQSVSRMFQDIYGCDHIRRQTRLSARLVKPQDARLLELPLGQPILLAESVNVDQDGKVIEYGVTRFRGDRMELEFANLPT